MSDELPFARVHEAEEPRFPGIPTMVDIPAQGGTGTFSAQGAERAASDRGKTVVLAGRPQRFVDR